MMAIWVTTAEVRVEPGDMPSGNTYGFMKILIWATSEADFLDRVRAYLEKYSWELLSVQATEQVDPDRDHGDEMNEMIDEMMEDQNFVRLGTYYSYTPE